MNLNTLRFGEFGKLATALADWNTLVTNLEPCSGRPRKA